MGNKKDDEYIPINIEKLEGCYAYNLPENMEVIAMTTCRDQLFLATNQGVYQVIPVKKWWQFWK